MNKIIKPILLIILLLGMVFFMGCIERSDSVKYIVTFDAFWSEEKHPDDFPSNPHFSGLIGASHNEEVSFWSVGEFASLGIKNMAETGNKNQLNIEIGKAILNETAYDILSGDGINPSPGSTNVTFTVSEDYPLVSLVTMIAPSPDWFVGVNGLNLYQNGSFVNEKIVSLYAYDAGTDNGTSYKSPDEPTEPPVTIFKIENYPFIYDDEIIPLGTFEFIKL